MPRLILDDVRKKKKLSKRKIAKRLNEDYKNVFRYFREGYNPTFATLVKIAAAMECRVRDLIQE